MKQSLQILHVEDSQEDSELIQHLLVNDGLKCDLTRVQTGAELFDHLQKEDYDLILSDCTLPNFSGLNALQIAHALQPELPFIFVSGTIGEEVAIESLRNGATDYVLKQHLTKLAPAVRRALDEAEDRTLCREMQHRIREAARLEALSTLSQGIAHDFNNVLAIIMGHASLLTVENERPDRVLELSATINEAARRATDIVQQLLAFAHKDEGRKAPTDINRWVEGSISLIAEKVPHRFPLFFEPARDLPTILIDGRQLERILHNLLDNAMESMPKGGRITLATEIVPAAEKPSLLPPLDSGIYVCLSVTDVGSGMDEQTRTHLFEPFYTTKERGRGTGLGLPVVYGLMKTQNGQIDVESEPGKGTKVSLYFPVPKPHPTKAAPLPPALDPTLCGSETILLVEDEHDVSFFLETILRKHGYKVMTAHDYDSALTQFAEHPGEIDMVFTDFGLPGADGITLCSKLREMNPDLHIILASGYSPREFKARMDELNDAVFLPKPFQTRDILLQVRKVLDGAVALPKA